MATTYELQQRVAGTSTWDPVGTVSVNIDGELRQTVGSLITGTTYEFRFVRNTGGALAGSNIVSATPAVPTTLADGGSMTSLGQYTVAGEGSITRTTTGTFVNFSAANWNWVGADINATDKFYASNKSTGANIAPNPIGVWVTDTTKVIKRSNRLVEILLPQSVAFTLKLSGETKSYSVTAL